MVISKNIKIIENEESYFEKLIQDQENEAKIKNELVNLLKNQIYKYTGGNSSVSKENAQMLMNTLIYVLSLHLKCYEENDALQQLQKNSLDQVYLKALFQMRNMMNILTIRVNQLQSTMLSIDYDVYKETIIDGFNAFLKYYNYEYNALDSVITFDYPTLYPIKNKEGIELFEQYLRYIEMENKFCCNFDIQIIQDVLIHYSYQYQFLFFNISELLLKQCLIKTLLKYNLNTLVLNVEELEMLYSLLKDKTRKNIDLLVRNAYQECIDIFNIQDINVVKYLSYGLSLISSQIFYGYQTGSLEKELSYNKNHS